MIWKSSRVPQVLLLKKVLLVNLEQTSHALLFYVVTSKWKNAVVWGWIYFSPDELKVRDEILNISTSFKTIKIVHFYNNNNNTGF